jgi:hypothetical protein
MNNESPYLPTQEAIKNKLDTHLKPHLGRGGGGLCPQVWEKFYGVHKDLGAAVVGLVTTQLIFPMWLTSQHMMRRHPRFFLTSTMMYGPSSCLARKDGTKLNCTAGTAIMSIVSCQTYPKLQQDIQDSIATDTILGKTLTEGFNSICDKLAKDWDDRIINGGMVFPYLPLFASSVDLNNWASHDIVFKSRAVIMPKDVYDP